MKFTLADIKREIEGPKNIVEISDDQLNDQIQCTIEGLSSEGIIERNPAIYKSMVKYLAETKLDSRRKGLLYFGNSGTGKSFAAKVISTFRGINYHTCGDLETKYERSTDAFWEVIRENKDIIIDDLGTEKTRHDYGNKFELMAKALEERHRLFERYGTKTIITANMSGDDIKNRYTERIYSRFFQMCECINATGKDLRR